MKTLLNHVFETSLAAFGLPREKYNFPDEVEAMKEVCEEILFDGIAKMMESEPFPFRRKGIDMKLSGLHVSEVWRVANKLNQDLRNKLAAIDPERNFEDIHTIKFDVEEPFNVDFLYNIVLTA